MNYRILLIILIFQFTILPAASQQPPFRCFEEFSQDDAQILKNLSDSSAIFLGIAEGVDVNYAIHAEMIKSLNEQSGIRNILVERSYGEAYLFNLFLESGNYKYLEYDMEWSEEMKTAFGKIYEFNKSNPESKKLRFYGFDGIMFLTPIIVTLKALMPNDKIPDLSIKSFIDSLKQTNIPFKTGKKYTNPKVRLKDLEQYIFYLRDEIKSKEKHYRNFFGDDFVHIDQIISNKATYVKQNRNKGMYQNILKLVNDFHLQNGVYGMVGELHVNLKYNGILAGYLKSDKKSPFKHKVNCISVHYENCKSAWPAEMASTKVDQKMKEELLKTTNCSNFIFASPKEPGYKSLSDRFDYLIFVSDKGPIHVLK